jgi:WD40 repeat protein
LSFQDLLCCLRRRLLLRAGATHAEVRHLPRKVVVHQLFGHTNAVAAAAFSSDGSVLLSAAHDWTLRVWDVAAGRLRCRLAGHRAQVCFRTGFP